MRRAWSKARRRIGLEPSSKRGGETGTRKLSGELRVRASNELPKCQEESARQFVSVETLVLIYLLERGDVIERCSVCRLHLLGSLPTDGGDCFAVGDARRCRVIFGVLIVIVLRQRSIDEIQNDSGNIDLPAVEKLERFFSETSRSIGKPNDKDGGIDFRCDAGRVVHRENGRAIDDDVIVMLIEFLEERFGRIAQELFARLGQSLPSR